MKSGVASINMLMIKLNAVTVRSADQHSAITRLNCGAVADISRLDMTHFHRLIRYENCAIRGRELFSITLAFLRELTFLSPLRRYLCARAIYQGQRGRD
jgi:hypothetical protein